ncbi:hypothetical protein F8M41_026534 [Gigaspora margarita]|uniref:Uncharacterized protein n=1 Tax=Gigaspora margarita TaxID=4874 RepID=A0A8H4AAG4_GIGMA|nr:hypothetical protein F8M41_026534 [Gigaspora margarita]
MTRATPRTKERINCASIHAVANAAVNNFTLAESSQINKMTGSDDKDHSTLAELGQRNEVANSDEEDHFTLAEPG